MTPQPNNSMNEKELKNAFVDAFEILLREHCRAISKDDINIELVKQTRDDFIAKVIDWHNKHKQVKVDDAMMFDIMMNLLRIKDEPEMDFFQRLAKGLAERKDEWIK